MLNNAANLIRRPVVVAAGIQFGTIRFTRSQPGAVPGTEAPVHLCVDEAEFRTARKERGVFRRDN